MASHSELAGHDAFAQVYAESAEPLARYALRLVGTIEEARDLVMDLFAELWLTSPRSDSPLLTRGYLYRAVRNRSLNHVQRTRRRAELATEWHGEHIGTAFADPLDDDPAASRISRLQSILARLPARTREALLLQRYDGLSYREIAVVMDISELTVKTHVANALRHLRDAMRHDDRADVSA
jgi:RNA polymerase sigma-70 factor (ECF subfamily)